MLLGGVIVAVILIPTIIAAISAASGIPAFVSAIQDGSFEVRPPPASLEGIPVAGPKLHAAWAQAANDFPAFLKEHGQQVKGLSRWLLVQAGSTFMMVLLLILAVILAAVCLAYAKGLRAFFAAVFARITGTRHQGEHIMDIISATVRSVANGVIGVAFVQALLVGIGFFVAGVPGAGILSLIVFMLGIVQVPVIIIVLPAIIWAFSAMGTTAAIIFTVWSLLAGLSDAVLKPMLIGHGLEVPMPIILLGVIGGVMAYGLIGLFFGAVILAVGYVLFYEWLGKPGGEAEAVAPKVKAG
jgi:predicted PurR-regulated permease PerM